MTNAELIAALRYCAEHEGCDYYIAKDCPREETWVCGVDCEQILMRDAADALEAADKRIEKLEAKMPKLPDRQEFLAKGSFIEEPLSRPKEAHWVAVQNGIGVCSNCNRQDSIDNMATHCRYCGARMKGEHDE